MRALRGPFQHRHARFDRFEPSLRRGRRDATIDLALISLEDFRAALFAPGFRVAYAFTISQHEGVRQGVAARLCFIVVGDVPGGGVPDGIAVRVLFGTRRSVSGVDRACSTSDAEGKGSNYHHGRGGVQRPAEANVFGPSAILPVVEASESGKLFRAPTHSGSADPPDLKGLRSGASACGT